MHVVKAFASENYERAKYNRKAEELRVEYYDAERMQGTNSAWMSLYFTFALGLILWLGGWLVVRGELEPGELAMFFLYLNQLTFPIRPRRRLSTRSRGQFPPASACSRCWMRSPRFPSAPERLTWDAPMATCVLIK